MRNPYKLPRKKKKEFKKRDSDLYFITHAAARLARETGTLIEVSKSFGNITLNVDMYGGTVGNGPQLLSLINPGQCI